MKRSFDMTEVNEAREKITDFYNNLCRYFINRDEILKLMVTATVAQEPLLFIGRPGTAKSLLVSVFCEALGLGQNEYFEYMLTKFTEPSEVMGPVDINALKNGSFIRKTSGHLPEAKIIFLDEIFKANSAILNMLLTIINERKYYQEGNPIPVPLVMFFAASNEIPDFSELDALKDRFILKVETNSVKDKYFTELIRQGLSFEVNKKNNNKPWISDCRLEDFTLLHDYIVTSVFPKVLEADENEILGSQEMTKAFKSLIKSLEEEINVEITDRKLIKLFKLIKTQAFLFNGGTVTREHLRILSYCGNNFKDINKIREMIADYLDRR